MLERYDEGHCDIEVGSLHAQFGKLEGGRGWGSARCYGDALLPFGLTWRVSAAGLPPCETWKCATTVAMGLLEAVIHMA